MERIRGTVKGRKIPFKTLHRKGAEHFTVFCGSNKMHTTQVGVRCIDFVRPCMFFKTLGLKIHFLGIVL